MAEKIEELKEIASDLLSQASGLNLSDKKLRILENMKKALEMDPLRGLKERTRSSLKELKITKQTVLEIRTRFDMMIARFKGVLYYLPNLQDDLYMALSYKKDLRRALKKGDLSLAKEIFETVRDILTEVL